MTTTETGSTELLPCPFCGGAQSQLQINTYADMSWVACPSCGLEAPSETGVSAAAAVTYWNTRPLRNAQSEAVAFPGYAFCSQGRDGSGYKVSYGFETMEQGHAFHNAVIAAQKIASAVAPKSSCPTCNGTGDHCGNPDFGQCDDCGGTGWLHALTHPAPPLAVTDEQTIIDAYLRGTAWRDENPGEDNSPYRFKAARDYADKTLTAALEAKQ